MRDRIHSRSSTYNRPESPGPRAHIVIRDPAKLAALIRGELVSAPVRGRDVT
jgi:hypothetical protein